MAIIKCPECGREISDKAISCPGCGYPVSLNNISESSEDNDKKKLKLNGISIFTFSLGFIMFCFLRFANTKTNSGRPSGYLFGTISLLCFILSIKEYKYKNLKVAALVINMLSMILHYFLALVFSV